MRFSRLSEEEVREILAAAADPSYRDMNRIGDECSFAERTADENLQQLIGWIAALERLGVRFEPSRDIPRVDVALL